MKLNCLLVLMLFALVCDYAYAQQKSGKATFYADKFHGRRTSNGEIYHRDSFTCAHNVYPFGTILKVRDKKTGKKVYVKVNDRIGHGTNLDLSFAAAKKLGIVNRGTATVEMTPMESRNRYLLANKEMEKVEKDNSVLQDLESLKNLMLASVDKEKSLGADYVKTHNVALLDNSHLYPQAPVKKSIMEATINWNAVMAQAHWSGSDEKTVDAR